MSAPVINGIKVGDRVTVELRVGNECEFTGKVISIKRNGQYFEVEADHGFYDQLGSSWRTPSERYHYAGYKHLVRPDEVKRVHEP